MNTKYILALCPLLSVSALLACASPAPTGATESASAPLVGAPLDTKNKWAVGICQGAGITNADAGRTDVCGATFCSATLVAPNLVLTAQHCIRNRTDPDATGNLCTSNFTSDDLAPGGLRMTLSDTVREGAPVWSKVSQVLVPKATGVCDNDIALLILEKPVPAADATPIGVELFRDLIKNPPSKLAMVARGATKAKFASDTPDAGNDVALGLDPTNYDRGEWRRRVLENIPFRCVGGTPGCILRDRTDPGFPGFNWVIPSAMFLGGRGLLYGDSGGGVVDQADFTAGKPKLLGVGTYFGVDDAGNEGDSGFVRASFHKDFLIEGATRAAAAGSYAVPEWTRQPATPAPDASTPPPAGDASTNNGGETPPPASTPPAQSSDGCSVGQANSLSGGVGGALVALGLLALRRRRREGRTA